jgi:tetratricopeptide (TPR) repeat protein
MKSTVIGFFACLIFLLQGCAQPGAKPDAESAPVAAPEAPAYTPQQGLTSQERFREVLYLLEQGEPVPARAELMVYLQDQPGSDVGADLLRQIDLPAEEYFPQDYRAVRLASGQSLSNLSSEYLGSIYKFHALAKYNGIPRPRRLKAGQDIRIPLTPEAIAAFDALDSQPPEPGPGESVSPAAAAEADSQPTEVSPTAEPLPDLEPELESELESELDSETGSSSPAVPDVEAMHREALNAYRAQNLTRAIALWDEVLIIDPDHENARLYRAQAIELQKKLRSLM